MHSDLLLAKRSFTYTRVPYVMVGRCCMTGHVAQGNVISSIHLGCPRPAAVPALRAIADAAAATAVSGAVTCCAGVRGPTAKAAGHALQLKSKAFEKAGAGSDEHGSWLFSSALDDHSDYVTLMGIHRRFLSPGMAVISHPSGAAGVPGKFGPWTAAAGSSGSSVWPLLVSPDSPPRPLLLPLVTKTASPAQKAANKRVVTLTWEFPAHASHTPLSPTYYKLYLAADPHFNTLLRQPTAAAFKPDIPANSLSVDVELSGSHVALDVYALLLACNSAACSRSCIGHYAVQ
jgi:hypothetical protein